MSMSQLDYPQVIKSVYDAANEALQVNVVASTGASSVVEITSCDGSGDKATVTAAKALKVDGSAVTQPVSAASLPLPTGASTSTLQTTGNTSLSSIDSKLGALGQKIMAGSAPVVIASDQSAIPVSAASLPLPSGAATEATLSTLNGKVTDCNTGAVVVSSSALPSGASTAAKQPSLGTAGTASADVITVQGITSMTPLLVNGSGSTQPVSNPLDTSSTSTCSNVSSSATSVSLLASTAGRKGAYIFNDSTQVLYIKFGTTASTTSYTVQVQPAGFYEMPTRPVYTGAIDGIWASANGSARITELT